PAALPAALPLKIGVARDSAFQFYYPDNLEALEAAGAEIVYISPLKEKTTPPLDALYLGGGFPETHARQLSENRDFNERLKTLVEDGMPVYAECGGLMFLGRELILEGEAYPMTGILPVSFGLSKKPKGHGYTILTVERENPYYPVGAVLHGHEFHYSYAVEWREDDADLVFKMNRGTGFHGKRDGVLYKNVLGLYSHVHALGDHDWARALIRNAAAYRRRES
ncbi:MAG: cobyrinic acid a,c-diamide synthase, partial [Desulfobacterales bacterium]|nr:cobyrinic acid a,c-diamide synthase [Desulfobacterales bacterium]